jgi:hypothetical protein
LSGSNECSGCDAATRSSSCGCPPLAGTYSDIGSVVIVVAIVEAKLLLCSSLLMIPVMSENRIPRTSGIGFMSSRSSLFSYLFISSMPTSGDEVIFHFRHIDLCSRKPSFQVILLETPRTRPHCSLVCRALVRVLFSLSPFESLLLSLKAL